MRSSSTSEFQNFFNSDSQESMGKTSYFIENN